MLNDEERQLVEESKYRENILFLLNNKKLAMKLFWIERGIELETGFYDVKYVHNGIYSNCFGTIISVLGLEKLFIYHPSNRFPQNISNPGYICEDSMFRFILSSSVKEISSPENDCIIIRGNHLMQGDLLRGYFSLDHSGIYLGKNKYFHQMGLGLPFCVENLFTSNPLMYPITRFFKLTLKS